MFNNLFLVYNIEILHKLSFNFTNLILDFKNLSLDYVFMSYNFVNLIIDFTNLNIDYVLILHLFNFKLN